MAGSLFDAPWAGQTLRPPAALDIASLEGTIVTQLQAYLGAALGRQVVEVVHFPDRPEAYEMRHRIGVVMVIYSGAEYGHIVDIGHVAQERTMEFEVGIRVRDLGWTFGGPPSGTSPGAYQVLEAVRAALLGFQPDAGCTPMRAVRERFVDRDKQGGVWVYAITFATRTVVVEDFRTPIFPPFTRGTAQEEGSVTSVRVPTQLWTFNGTPGSFSLTHGNISNVVVSSADLTITYTQDVDYTLDTVNGVISIIIGGNIAAGTTVAVSYSYSDIVTALASGGNVPLAPNN